MPRVFISHSFLDTEFVEREIIPLLTESGLEVWYSEKNIEPGAEWGEKLNIGLRDCDWFLVVLSPNS
ncbi:MAG TPA: toll/interleukin-1 receptor domain-containing protein, partial [Pyrinomonadaceae bacterium]|nr:toll/interleukin-1 receptor domain-containing protein [Pyrinomonadaceae bacterium]